MDLLLNGLEENFKQEDLNQLESLENLLLEAYRGNVPSEEILISRLGIHSDDFNTGQLHTQLKMLESMPGDKPICCKDIAKQLKENSSTVRLLLNQVERLTILIMTIPASAATAERSHSALKRLKTYLRSTMTQKHLTHVTLLHIHKDRTAKLNLEEIAKEFVSRSNRKVTFGEILM